MLKIHKSYLLIGTTSFTKPAYARCTAWPLVTHPVASFDRESLAGVPRSRWLKETGVDLGFLTMVNDFDKSMH